MLVSFLPLAFFFCSCVVRSFVRSFARSLFRCFVHWLVCLAAFLLGFRSERASATNNRGEQLRQGANINKSLLSLANCINALAGNRRRRGGKVLSIEMPPPTCTVIETGTVYHITPMELHLRFWGRNISHVRQIDQIDHDLDHVDPNRPLWDDVQDLYGTDLAQEICARCCR